ncbi:MAG TPA: acylphosphatase [Candidatus Binatia bacterium]|nr:acylphosphatase [Candidatus Binatia bacterium]
MHKQVHIILRGRVQGVGFRFFIRDRARQLGLTGWACNLADGSVEAVAVGEHKRLQQFVALCSNGPPGAVVQDISVEWQDAGEELANFVIR